MKSPRYFIDTNIIVYCFDKRDPAKQDAARNLVADALESGTGVISYQVVQEFINLATRRFATQFKPEDLQDFLSDVLFLLLDAYPSKDLYLDALQIHHRYGYSNYDSLIIASALSSGCAVLYSEDLQHGHKIRNMVIKNPFAGFHGRKS